MDMPSRMLKLLSLLQGRREWTGTELAERLGVTDRTVRRDIERLRGLGYPVDGTTGVAGGYRLASGRNLPPLLLDDDEAVAVAVGLRTAAGVRGIEESSVRTLAKLEQMLPARLRHRVNAVGEATVSVGPGQGARCDPTTLGVLAAACRDREVVAFSHRGQDRKVEPRNLVTAYGRWYLLAYDPGRADWRAFRADRMSTPRPTGRRFTPRTLPLDPATYVARALTKAPYRYTATALVRAPADVVLARLPAPLPEKVEPVDATTCRVRLGANTARAIAADLVSLGAGYTLDAPAELLAELDAIGRALGGGGRH